MTTFKSILVATDFSAPAEQATALAVQFARTLDAKLTLLHVYELPTPYEYTAGISWPLDEVERQAKIVLERELTKLRDTLPAATSRLSRGEPVERILAEAKDIGADLIVLGTHGRKGLAHVFLGSVAEKVVRRATVPVLTVGPRASELAKKNG